MERNRAVVIVLSGGLNADDEPSPRMKTRLDLSCQVYKAGDFNGIITTSKGTFRDKRSHSVTEAEAARLYLISHGINPSRVFKEEKSMDTIGNPFFCRLSILEPRGWWMPTIITNEYHMPRAKFLFDRVLDDKYQPEYISATNQGISPDELEVLQRHEEEMMGFYQEALDGVRKGDLEFFEEYIYKHNPRLYWSYGRDAPGINR